MKYIFYFQSILNDAFPQWNNKEQQNKSLRILPRKCCLFLLPYQAGGLTSTVSLDMQTRSWWVQKRPAEYPPWYRTSRSPVESSNEGALAFVGLSDGPGASLVANDKDSSYNAGASGDTVSIPGSGRSPGEGNGNSLQSSCLKNPVHSGAWWAKVHRVAKSRTWLQQLSMHACRLGCRKTDMCIFGTRQGS